MRKFALLAVLAVGCGAGTRAEAAMATVRLGSAEKGAGAPAEGKLIAYVVETAAAPAIDGALDEEAWSKAKPARLLRTLDGGGKASQKTEYLLLRDAKMLYVGVRCVEPLMDKIQGARRAHDADMWSDDFVEFFLGVPKSGIYYHFAVNSFGSTYDGQEKVSGWNSEIKAAGAKGKAEWTAECAIPLEKIQEKGKELTALVGNFHRTRLTTGKMEEWAWSPTLSGNSHVPERFADILFAAPPKEEGAPKDAAAPGKKMEVLACEGGDGVVRFELGALPKDAKIFRAELKIARTGDINGNNDEAAKDFEILPLFEAFAGGAPKGAGKALALRAPWFDGFDATEAVREWAGGKPNGGFFFKSGPAWEKESTALDIYYEGKPENPPAQVTEVKAFHNAGQTFITWKEIDDPVGRDAIVWGEMKPVLETLDRLKQVRYNVYRHTQPITADSLPAAQLIASVKPASCWNVNGRSIEKGIDRTISTLYYLNHGHWNPFANAKMDGEFGRDCVIERLVVKDGEKPLERGTGLYVHTVEAGGKAHYAVVSSVNGIQNTVDISEKCATAALDETKAEPQPVLQKEFPRQPYFNYREKRLHYVRWEAPPFCNLPCQYYNWAVGVPDGVEKAKGLSLELSLPHDDRTYQRTLFRIEPDSLIVTPHDFPAVSWWYGYHEALGTLKSFKQGVVQPYTERRVLWFVDWAAKKWPVDRNRIYVTTKARSGSFGAACSGALHLAIRNPQIFTAVYPGYGALPEYAGAVHPSMTAMWGKVDWASKTDTGKNVWEELDLVKHVAALPPSTNLPLVTLPGKQASKAVLEFMALMLERGHSLFANFNEWGGTKIIPVSANSSWPPPLIRCDARQNQILPSFGHAKAAGLRNTAKPYAQINLGYRWKSDDIVDKADRIEITVWREGREEAASDITLRRMQNFKPEPGKTYPYVNAGTDGKEVEKGEAAADKDGVLTLKNVKISDKGTRLIVTGK